MSRRSQPPYRPELKQRAVRMVGEIEADDESPWQAMRAVAASRLAFGPAGTIQQR